MGLPGPGRAWEETPADACSLKDAIRMKTTNENEADGGGGGESDPISALWSPTDPRTIRAGCRARGWFFWGYRIDRLVRGPLLSFSLEPFLPFFRGSSIVVLGILGIRHETLVYGFVLADSFH